MTWPNDMLDRANEIYYDIMQRREEYIRAWIAEKGYWPSQCEVVEDRLEEDGKIVYRTIYKVRGDR